MRTATFALLIGIAYLSVGLLSLEALLTGLLPVNILQSAAHIAIAVWGLLAWRGKADPRVFARAAAILFGALAVLGIIPATATLFGTPLLYGFDVWLHCATAVLAAYFGWRLQTDAERRGGPRTERRTHTEPVEHDRRHGRDDRRQPLSEV